MATTTTPTTQARAAALAQHLETKPEEIRHDQGEEFTVSPRRVLEGTSPEQYRANVDNLRTVLDKGAQGLISAAVETIEAGELSKEKRDEVYKEAAGALKRYHTAGESAGIVTRREREAWAALKADTLHPENVIYWLLDAGEEDRTAHIGRAYRQAWAGLMPADERKAGERSQGSYLVLTEEEAEKMADEYAENFADEYGTPEGIDPKYIDREAIKSDYLADGRGPVLAGYDGTEIEAGEFYIYRTN